MDMGVSSTFISDDGDLIIALESISAIERNNENRLAYIAGGVFLEYAKDDANRLFEQYKAYREQYGINPFIEDNDDAHRIYNDIMHENDVIRVTVEAQPAKVDTSWPKEGVIIA